MVHTADAPLGPTHGRHLEAYVYFPLMKDSIHRKGRPKKKEILASVRLPIFERVYIIHKFVSFTMILGSRVCKKLYNINFTCPHGMESRGGAKA
jgi:hypothetical protein